MMNRLNLLLLALFFGTGGVFGQEPAGINLKDGLVAYYPFDGTADDSTSFDHHGIIHGASSHDVLGRCGEEGKSYFFNGNDAHIEVKNSEAFSGELTGITVSAWINPSMSNSSEMSMILGKWAFDKNKDQFALFLTPQNVVCFAIGDPEHQDVGAYGHSRLAPDAWHHVVALWRKGKGVKVFVDGVLEHIVRDEPGKTMNAYSNLPLRIGKQVEGKDRAFKGHLDDIRVYNRALTDPEVAALHKMELTPCEKHMKTLSANKAQKTFTVKGRVFDQQTNTPLDAEIYFRNTDTEAIVAKTKTHHETGDYWLELHPGVVYSISTLSPEYVNNKVLFNTSSYTHSEEIEKDLPMRRLPSAKPSGPAVITLTGKLMDDETHRPIDAEIILKDLATGEIVRKAKAGLNGLYSLEVLAGKKYEIIASHDDFITEKKTVEIPANMDPSEKLKYGMHLKHEDHMKPEEGEISIKGRILNKKTMQPVSAIMVIIIRDKDGKTVKRFKTMDGDGGFHFIVPRTNEGYKVFVSADRYHNLQETIGAAPALSMETEKNLLLEPIVLSEKDFEMVKGTVTDENTGKGVPGRVLIQRHETGEDVAETFVDDHGHFKTFVPKDGRYFLHADADGYFAISEELDLRNSKDSVLSTEIHLVPMHEGQAIKLTNVFFETGANDLLEDSFVELDRIVGLFEEYPKLQAELGGHSDNQGNADNNIKLSQQRADAVKAYLVKKGVAKDKIITKGYGPAEPIAPNSTPEGRQKNRRVEMKVVKLY